MGRKNKQAVAVATVSDILAAIDKDEKMWAGIGRRKKRLRREASRRRQIEDMGGVPTYNFTLDN